MLSKTALLWICGAIAVTVAIAITFNIVIHNNTNSQEINGQKTWTELTEKERKDRKKMLIGEEETNTADAESILNDF